MKPGRRRLMGLALGAVAGGLALPSASRASAVGMTFEMYKDRGGEFRWRLKASNGQIVATSGQGYGSKADCKREIEQIQKNAATATIVDDTAKS